MELHSGETVQVVKECVRKEICEIITETIKPEYQANLYSKLWKY
jgi:hypothetical protein